MKKFGLLIVLISSLSIAQNAWINEFHYDNDGVDANEFIEVVIQNPENFNLADFTITLYNGSDGAAYGTRTVDDFIVGVADPFNSSMRYFYTIYPANGIQNGSPDGICLDYQGTVLHFISYEGTFAATNGVANGLTSTDIGVSETGSTPLESSIGLTGTGTTYAQLTWSYFSGASTAGDPNGGQELPVELTSFSATTIGKDVTLSWNTATEINNYGFDVERKGHTSTSLSMTNWEKIGFVNGNGNSNSPKDYSLVDSKVSTGKYSYRLKQIDNDGQFEYSKTIEVDMNGNKKFELSQNYPNPFNPITTIRFNLPGAGNVKLTLFNLLGQEIMTLVNEYKESGVHTINFDASNLNSGMYIYKIEAGSFVQTRKMTLVK